MVNKVLLTQIENCRINRNNNYKPLNRLVKLNNLIMNRVAI